MKNKKIEETMAAIAKLKKGGKITSATTGSDDDDDESDYEESSRGKSAGRRGNGRKPTSPKKNVNSAVARSGIRWNKKDEDSEEGDSEEDTAKKGRRIGARFAKEVREHLVHIL